MLSIKKIFLVESINFVDSRFSNLLTLVITREAFTKKFNFNRHEKRADEILEIRCGSYGKNMQYKSIYVTYADCAHRNVADEEVMHPHFVP